MIEPGWWVTQTTTLLVAAMGVGILRVKPRTASSHALAALLLCYSLGAFGFNVAIAAGDGPLVVALALATTILYLGLVLASARLLQSFPQPLRRDERGVLWTFVVLVGVAALASIPVFFPARWFAEASVADAIVRGMFLVGLPGVVAILAVAIGLAHRYQRVPPSPEGDSARRQLVLMAAGLVIPSVFNIGTNLLAPALGVGALLGALFLASGMAAWLRAARVERGGKEAYAVAWLVGLVALAAIVVRAAGFDADGTGAFGVARVFAFAILAYGLLSAQLLGIDVKLRFAISKSTLAAVFVAVFFIASEAAQQFFGDRFESSYLGILAAGALVFAISPLSRLADRLAERAVPPAGAPAAGIDPDREATFRSAVRLALRDRRLTRSEERELFRVARGLGIASERAHEILAEMETSQGIPQ